MICKNNHEQKKMFYINQYLYIESSLGEFLLQYFPPEFNRFKQMKSNYLGFWLGFCLFPLPKTWKIAKKPGKLPKNLKIKQRFLIRCRGFGLGGFKIFGEREDELLENSPWIGRDLLKVQDRKCFKKVGYLERWVSYPSASYLVFNCDTLFKF